MTIARTAPVIVLGEYGCGVCGHRLQWMTDEIGVLHCVNAECDLFSIMLRAERALFYRLDSIPEPPAEGEQSELVLDALVCPSCGMEAPAPHRPGCPRSDDS